MSDEAGAPGHAAAAPDGARRRLSPEDALRESEARLELATAAAGIGIWDWDVLTGQMEYSPRARAISGFAPDEELTFDKVRDIVHPEDYPRTSAMARDALDPALRARIPYEYRIVRPDGETRWVLAHGEAVFEEMEGATRAVRYVGTIQDVTVRHELEAARRASEQRLALAIEAGRMAVWEVDIVRDQLIGTPELNRLLGHPEDVILDIETVRAGYYPGEQERLQQVAQKVMERGQRFFETEFRYVRPDGSLRWLMLRAELLFDENGTPTRAVGVLMDVTGRKATEGALRASEARVKLALQAAGAGVFEWDLATDQLEWSPEIYDIFGFDPAEVGEDLQAAWRAAVHPDDLEAALGAGQRAIEEGGSFTVDFRISRPDGETRWVRSRGTAVPGPDGKPTRITGIDLDVTEQNRDTETLRARAEETERERDRIYELSSDLFAVAGFDGYLRVVNPAWERLLGSGQDELLAAQFIDRIHPEDRAATAETVGLLRHGREVRQFENRILAADGREISISWSAVSEGDLFYVVGRDVTRDKEREEALRQAQKMEAVGQLTGGIAHDFNNLLQAVHGNFDLIRRRASDAKLRRWAENGAEAAERGAKLTSQLLAFSRAQKLEMKHVDLSTLLRDMESLLARTLGPMIRIGLDLSEENITVLADPTQLEMAILNLAINARDAMPEGGTLAIRTGVREERRATALEPGSYAFIEVSDTGSGMEADVAERAFDPFFTTKGVGKGTGLGLSQVYGMARQAGGGAAIRSIAGTGTTVTLLLRCTSALEPEADEARGAAAKVPARPATVLVVDDDPDVRRFLADTLGDIGYTIIEAESGDQALGLLGRTRPDLIIVDYAMPEMNGAELADEARRRHPDVPILFASGYADSAAIETAVGPDALLLRKPFRIDELEAAVAAAIGSKG